MPEFEIDYSWQERHYGTTSVNADDIGEAEKKAFDVLGETFDTEEYDEDIEKTLFIESIREVRELEQSLS